MFDFSFGSIKVDIENWSTALKLSTNVEVRLSGYNISNSQWEPIVEPWNFTLTSESSFNNETTEVTVKSDKKLDIDLSTTFIENLLNINNLWVSRHIKAPSRRSFADAPYIIRNYTGYDISIWNESIQQENTELFNIKTFQQIPWRFEDWRQMREAGYPANYECYM